MAKVHLSQESLDKLEKHAGNLDLLVGFARQMAQAAIAEDEKAFERAATNVVALGITQDVCNDLHFLKELYNRKQGALRGSSLSVRVY